MSGNNESPSMVREDGTLSNRRPPARHDLRLRSADKSHGREW